MADYSLPLIRKQFFLKYSESIKMHRFDMSIGLKVMQSTAVSCGLDGLNALNMGINGQWNGIIISEILFLQFMSYNSCRVSFCSV